ncbi:acyl-CoA synthetase (AMP-forming)/AMP-acid ligase II [Bradyrhizobium japonicum]
MAMPVSRALSSQITTRFTQPVKTIADIEALEQRPYDSLVPSRNLLDLFEATAHLHPDRPALTVLTKGSREPGDATLTHRQLLAEIIRAANLFRSHGIGESGGTAAFLCPILPPLFPALLGAQVAGVASSINYLLNEDAIADLLEAQNATVRVIPAEAADRAIWAKAANVAKRVPSLKTIFVIGANGPLPGGFLNFNETAASARGTLDFAPSTDRNAICALFHTGGTTGRPKLVRLTHGNQIHAAWSFAQVHGLDELDAAVNGFPLFHVGGTMTLGLSILAAGGHVIIPSPYSLRSPEAIRDYWHTVERFRATIVSGVPTSIAALAEVPIGSSDVRTVRMALTGGAVAPKAVSDRFQARTGITLFETYGMTETAAAIAFNPGRGTPVQGSVGFRAPFAKTKIVALTDAELKTECPPLTSGLVLVRGPQVFPGYVDPQHNKGVLTDDHWIVTGDVGYLTSDQRLVLTGREKDLIVRSGHNIDPAAIEDVANAFPGVQMSSAVGMPDAYAGEVPVLFVVPSPGQTIDLAHCASISNTTSMSLLRGQSASSCSKLFRLPPSGRSSSPRFAISPSGKRSGPRSIASSAPTPRRISSSRKTRSSTQSSASRSIPVIWIEQRCSSKALQRFHKPIALRTDRPDGRATAGSKKGKTGMKRFRFNQQEIVFAVFALLFLVFSIFLRGFLTPDNMLTLLQNVAVLGILGLAMAIVVIGRGIDISLIAALAVPPGLVLQMVQNGHSLPASLLTAVLLTIAFGLVNGWLIAYAEVPSLFATLATGLLLAGLGQTALFQLDVVQWSPGMDGFERLGQGTILGIPTSIWMFAIACIVVAFLLRQTRWGAYIYAIGDNPTPRVSPAFPHARSSSCNM